VTSTLTRKTHTHLRELKLRRAIDVHDGLLTELARPIHDTMLGPNSPGAGGVDRGADGPGGRR
jgi:hypothetical protein